MKHAFNTVPRTSALRGQCRLANRIDLSKAMGQWHLLLLCLAALLLLSGCAASTSSEDRGHLVIVGGGLKDEHAVVFNRFVSLCADGPIGIIPIASGDGIKAGESSAERWRKYSGTRSVIVIPLTQNDAAKSDDPEIARQIASCGGLWFTGGQQDRVVNVLRPGGKRGACLAACFTVLHRNGVIGGTSAGAAIMSDPMITGGRSASAKSRDPDNEDNHHVTTSAGLGFFTFGLTDQHFIQRGRQGRLVDALHDTKTARGFGVSENCALVVDRATAGCEVIGEQAAVWMIDTSPSKPAAGIRVSILGNGDALNARSGEVHPLATMHRTRGTGIFEPLLPVTDVWAFSSIETQLRVARSSSSGTATTHDALTSLTLETDDQSRVFEGDARFPCYINLHMVIAPARAK